MKIAFFGTSDVAARFFAHLMSSSDVNVAVVVTVPDRPAGRGMKMSPPAVKEAAAAAGGIKIFQPESASSAELAAGLRGISPDLGVVVSYGKLIPREVIDIPRLGCVNVHFSLLPRYRGAAPIQWALINGDTETGASVFMLEEKLDTGPIVSQRKTPISVDDDFFTLRDKLITDGKAALGEAIRFLASGAASTRPQTGEPSLAPALKKEAARIKWSASAASLGNLIRGTLQWPVARCLLPDGRTLKILKAQTVETCDGSGGKCPVRVSPGMVTGLAGGEGFIVACGGSFLKILEVRPENSRSMSAWDFTLGRGVRQGDILG
ncbi:MAG: methionyl-tRNA formyltransferase [Elusimicrobia bacterium HGW-Elusimicrobia-1]|jgi:methionyl-tRNA formyltransferase|nr:MAG: methionyl-tRNA formyltransferase [Elusimicrobia bacterium HGW-Elusimicrobia-1]